MGYCSVLSETINKSCTRTMSVAGFISLVSIVQKPRATGTTWPTPMIVDIILGLDRVQIVGSKFDEWKIWDFELIPKGYRMHF